MFSARLYPLPASGTPTMKLGSYSKSVAASGSARGSPAEFDNYPDARERKDVKLAVLAVPKSTYPKIVPSEERFDCHGLALLIPQ